MFSWFMRISGPEIERLIDVLLRKLKARFVLQVLNVAQAAGQQIVHAYYAVAFTKQRIAKVRSHKSRSACHQYPHRSFPSQLNYLSHNFHRYSFREHYTRPLSS